jgi:hypothetical protein
MTESDEQLSDSRTSTGSEPITTCIKYYELKKNWPRVKPHLADKKLNEILVKDFNKFTFGRWKQTFFYGDLPYDFESCDWDCDSMSSTPLVTGW